MPRYDAETLIISSKEKMSLRSAHICVIYESSLRPRAWKGERVGELIEALDRSDCRVFFIGLRGLREAPIRIGRRRTCLQFALPGQVARLAALLSDRSRDVRTLVAQFVFAMVTWPLGRRTFLTQTTLGGLVEALKARGHTVWAECDMTCPKAWRAILMDEAHRLGLEEEMESELPTPSQSKREARSFEAADRIVVFSPWALKNFPEEIRAKSVMVPPISVRPADRPLGGDADTFPVEFLFVGQVSFRKGAHLLMAALQSAALGSVTCHVFGALRDNFRAYMKRTGQNFPGNVHIHGPGDWRNFVKERRARYVAVLPSLVEGSPRFIYEAASLGIPAIVAPAAHPAIFDHNSELLALSRPDTRELTDAALRFLEEADLWQNLSANSYRRYCSAYNADSYGTRIVSLLAQSRE